jgi:hypothetical protein
VPNVMAVTKRSGHTLEAHHDARVPDPTVPQNAAVLAR